MILLVSAGHVPAAAKSTRNKQQQEDIMRRDFPIHLDLQGIMDKQCFGELEEYCEYKPGHPRRVYYICAKCGQEIDGSIVLNHDRDTADWEFDMRYQGDY